ncbi:MAG: hypothetical protein H7233_03345, partial [Pseudorhodobacter sp.]|nr:hypothetical protein [Frankiaceae bacterium]
LRTVLPLLRAAALPAVPPTGRGGRTRRVAGLPWWWVPLSCLPALVTLEGLSVYSASSPLTWSSGARAPYVDTYAHLSWAAELAHRGPERFPWVKSEVLGYHWFSHAWVAHVSVAGHVPLDAVLLRLLPAAVPLWIALAVAVAALRLTGALWTGPVAALLCLAGGHLAVGTWRDAGTPALPGSPSLGLAAPPLLLLVVLLVLRWRGQLGRAGLPLVLVMALAAAGTKALTLPLVLAGVVLAVAVFLIQKKPGVRGLVVEAVVLLVPLELAIQFVYRGSGGGLALDPQGALAVTEGAREVGGTSTAGAVVLAVVLVLVADLARGAGLGLALRALRERTARPDPLPWVLLGVALASVGAVLGLAQAGHSQAYFVLSAGPLLALGSVVGLASAVPRTRRASAALLVGLAGGITMRLVSPGLFLAGEPTLRLAFPPRHIAPPSLHSLPLALAALVLMASLLGVTCLVASRVLRLGGAGVALAAGVTGVAAQEAADIGVLVHRPVAATVSVTHQLAVSRGQVDAARWIRDHSGVDDLVMTNRHCAGVGSPVRGCDSRRFVVAAFSERQVLLEGWTYTPRSAAISSTRSITVPYWHPELLALNDGFLAHPSRAAAAALRALGVRWVFADHTRPHAATLAPYAVPRFRDPDVDVYELTSMR